MDRWNELIAGFVLGNLTPEEADSVAQILAENPQLAVNIARLRNTATVRSMRSAEWSTARSQDGSEGWADTALDLPEINPPSGLIDSRLLAPAAEQPQLLAHRPSRRLADGSAKSQADTSQTDRPRHSPFYQRWRSLFWRESRQWPRPGTEGVGTEGVGIVKPLTAPLFSPLWWLTIVAIIVVGIDDFRVRRSLSAAQAEIAQLKAIEPLENDE